MRRTFTALLCAMMMVAVAGCGGTSNDAADGDTNIEQNDAETLLDMGKGNLPSGLSGECTGNHENLSNVRLSTSGQYLTVSIDNPPENMTQKKTYAITLTAPGSDIQSQVGLSWTVGQRDSLRYIYDMQSSEQKNYGAFGQDDMVREKPSGSPVYELVKLETAVPDTAIKAGKTMKWHATLNVDGNDYATCPADGSDAVLQ